MTKEMPFDGACGRMLAIADDLENFNNETLSRYAADLRLIERRVRRSSPKRRAPIESDRVTSHIRSVVREIAGQKPTPTYQAITTELRVVHGIKLSIGRVSEILTGKRA